MRYSTPVDNLVFEWNEHQQETFQILRNQILDANPMVVESVKYNVPFYTLNGLLMYISPLKNGGIYLSFCQGELMLDPEELFITDTTKNVRKIYFLENETPNWGVVYSYVLEAIEINLQNRSFTKNKKPN